MKFYTKLILAAILLCFSTFTQSSDDFDLSGSWYDPENPGWGVLVDKGLEGTFVAIFTYNFWTEDPGQAFYVGFNPSSICNMIPCSTPTVAGHGTGTDVAGHGTGKEVAGHGTGKEVAGSGSGKEVAGSGSGTEVAGSGSGTEVAGHGTGAEVAGSGSGSEVAGSGSGSEVAGSGSGTDVAGSGSGSEVAGSGSGADVAGSGSGKDVAGSGSGTDAEDPYTETFIVNRPTGSFPANGFLQGEDAAGFTFSEIDENTILVEWRIGAEWPCVTPRVSPSPSFCAGEAIFVRFLTHMPEGAQE